jgi:formate dehydrogenase subunit gamma
MDAERLQPGDRIHRGHPMTVDRYGPAARANHWIIAASLILLSISGMALFYPTFFPLTALFGGGQWTRFIHPWIGVVLFVSFFVFFAQLWRANLPTRTDVVWVSHLKDVVAQNEDKLPELGKYNAGQKFIFWAMSGLIIALIVSGVIIWDQYFADATAIETKRFAILAHAICAVLIICVFILHLYAGIWTRGTLRAMTRGSVTGGWAYRHHRKWLKQMVGARRIDPAE